MPVSRKKLVRRSVKKASRSRRPVKKSPRYRMDNEATYLNTFQSIQEYLNTLRETHPPFRRIADLCTEDGDDFSWNDEEALDIMAGSTRQVKAVISSMHSLCLHMARFRRALADSELEKAREHLDEILDTFNLLEKRVNEAFP